MTNEDGEKKSSKLEKLLGWVFVLALILLFIYVPDWGFIKGEITEYSIAPCPECPTRMMTLNSRKYKPNVKTQEVLSWMPDFGFPDRYTNCAVVSRTNWECS